MMIEVKKFLRPFLKKDLPDLRPGDTVRVSQKAKGGEKEKTQVFEGLIIAINHGGEIGATIIVRRVISGVGVERIFPIHSPAIEKIEVLRRGRVRRAKLYYLRRAKGKKAKLKKRGFAEAIAEEISPEKTEESEAIEIRQE